MPAGQGRGPRKLAGTPMRRALDQRQGESSKPQAFCESFLWVASYISYPAYVYPGDIYVCYIQHSSSNVSFLIKLSPLSSLANTPLLLVNGLQKLVYLIFHRLLLTLYDNNAAVHYHYGGAGRALPLRWCRRRWQVSSGMSGMV